MLIKAAYPKTPRYNFKFYFYHLFCNICNHLNAEKFRQSVKNISKGKIKKQIKSKPDLGLCEHREPLVHVERRLLPTSIS